MHPPDEDGALFSVLLMGTVVALVVGGFVLGGGGTYEPGAPTTMIGVGLVLVGVVCVLSYFIPHKAFVFRGVMYLCTHTNLVLGRWTVFLSAAVWLAMGVGLLRRGLGLG